MNKVILIGNLGNDPEVKVTPSGKSVTTFSLATQYGKDSPTQWHKIEAWEKTGELVAKFLTKGSKAAVEGRLNYTSSEKDGEKRYFIAIVAERVEFLGGKQTEEADGF